MAYVQLRPQMSASASELLAFAQGCIPERAAHPKAIQILPTLPVTAIGKIFKPALSVMEVESVVSSLAAAQGLTLKTLQVVQDPRRGIVAQIGLGELEQPRMQAALGPYTFQYELLPD